MANLTLKPLGSLRPLVRTEATAEYFEDVRFAAEPSSDLVAQQSFANGHLVGDRRDERWNYIDDSGVVYQLVSPPKSAAHQPDIDLWVDDGWGPAGFFLYSRPPEGREDLYQNRKLVTFPDSKGRSFEIVLEPDSTNRAVSYTFKKQTRLINHPLEGTFNWTDDSVNPWRHAMADVKPHFMPFGGNDYLPVKDAAILQPAAPEETESLYDNGMAELERLSGLVGNLAWLQAMAIQDDRLWGAQYPRSISEPTLVQRWSEGELFRYRLVPPSGRLSKPVEPEFNHALVAYLEKVGLSCDDEPERRGELINTPAPDRCVPSDSDEDSILSDNRFYPDPCP